jgi:hypothetical protein
VDTNLKAVVEQIKAHSAELIALCNEELRRATTSTSQHLWQTAMNTYELGQQQALKAAEPQP